MRLSRVQLGALVGQNASEIEREKAHDVIHKMLAKKAESFRLEIGTTYEQRLRQFHRFHARNPQVYIFFVGEALRAKRAGEYTNARLIIELYRKVGRRTDGRPYKVSNGYPCFYARLAMTEEPELAGFFSIHEEGEKGMPNDD